jgi:hypothetical protein
MAKDSLVKASTPEPWSRSKTSNWVARGGGLPDYIQHISHDIAEKRGIPESQAIAIAIGVVKNWAAGKGNVDATTRAAAAKAVAEWEKLKAKNAAKGGKIKEAPVGYLATELGPEDLGDLSLLEAKADADAEDKKDGGADEASEDKAYCVKCAKKVQPSKGKKCPTCGTDLSKAVAAAKKAA